MSEDVPIYDSLPPDENEWDKQLVALFADLKKEQLGFLDESGKRIAELVTALIGVLFAVAAFGDKFPPPYLENSLPIRLLTILVLVVYVAALLAAVYAIRPRTYKRPRYNITEMEEELDRIVKYKSRWVEIAGALFIAGSISLAFLVLSIVLSS